MNLHSSDEHSNAKTFISVVICTRNRSDCVVHALDSVFANTYPSFDVTLVDQSTDDQTACAIDVYRTNSAFRYVRSSTTGVGKSRNIGINTSKGAIIAFVDDDCIVPTNWLELLNEAFHVSSRIGIVFSNVLSGAHDAREGYIPSYVQNRSRIIHNLFEKCTARGIGAGLSLRRTAVQQISMFDEALGAGSMFPSCEDWDIAVRALINGWLVYETSDIHVIHEGFRTWKELRDLTKRDWYGIGAAYAKPLKCGYVSIIPVIVYEFVYEAMFRPISLLFRLKKPNGLRRAWFFAIGLHKGLSTPVNRQTMTFIENTL